MVARGWCAPAVLAVCVVLSACGDRNTGCRDCESLTIVATNEPASLLPPLVFETVGRDISDQIYERLAELAPGAAPIDAAAYRPRLAVRWEQLDSLTWRFRLRDGARWHDGRPVTAEDVVFSFEAFSDSLLDAAARPWLAGKITATADDSLTVRLRFAAPSPEQLYDATWHVRILPRHIWSAVPREAWEADTAQSHVIGSGPYRLSQWKRGEYLTLAAAPDLAPRPAITTLVWRFAQDADAALNLVLSHEAQLMEAVGSPDRVARVVADSALTTMKYPSAVYGFLAFRLSDPAGKPHPLLSDRAVRRALSMAIDRASLARAIFGADAAVPRGPMSRLLWIASDSIQSLPFDTATAAAALRRRSGHRPLDILVPSSSANRRQLAVAIQEAWRKVGVEATVTAVDFPVFQERLAQGKFDSYIGAYLDEPSPRGLAEQWTRSGFGALNHGRYANPVFDSLLARAGRERDVVAAKRLWREAMDTLNADTPAIFLYSPSNVAAASRRLSGVEINPYSWLSGVQRWRVS